MTQPDSRYATAASAWVEHLRGGGTTPWREFWPTSPAPAQPLDEALIPGSAQLELVRRVARVWKGPGFERVADRVLARDGAGRGMAVAPLPHPDRLQRFGAPALDPSEVPVHELIRVGVGVLADLALASPASYVAPAVDSPALARGHSLGRRDVAIWAPSFEILLTRAWSLRVQRGSGTRWRRFVQLCSTRAQLPRPVDVQRQARRTAARVGVEHVHLFVERTSPHGPQSLSVASVDLLRRVNPLLDLHVADPAPARAALVAVLDRSDDDVLAVPPPHRAWVSSHADRLCEGIRSDGYAVHGDLEQFARAADAPSFVAAGSVLDRLVVVVARAEQRAANGTSDGSGIEEQR